MNKDWRQQIEFASVDGIIIFVFLGWRLAYMRRCDTIPRYGYMCKGFGRDFVILTSYFLCDAVIVVVAKWCETWKSWKVLTFEFRRLIHAHFALYNIVWFALLNTFNLLVILYFYFFIFRIYFKRENAFFGIILDTMVALVIFGDVCSIFHVCKSVMLNRFLCHIHSTIYVRRGRKAAFWYERRSTCRRAIKNAMKPSFDVDDRSALWSKRILRCFCWPPTKRH